MITQLHNQDYNKYSKEFLIEFSVLSSVNKYIKLIFGAAGLMLATVVLSPILVIALWRLIYIANKMVKGVQKLSDELPALISGAAFTYKEAESLKALLENMIATTKVVNEIKRKEVPLFLSTLVNSLFIVHEKISSMLEILNNLSLYTQKDLGLSDKEFSEYNQQFKSLEDIWDYPTTKDESELIFNHKKQLHS